MKLKKQTDEPTSAAAVPENLRRLAELTLISKFEALDKRLRTEAGERDRENREKIDGLLLRLAPVDAELRMKIDVFGGLIKEWRAIGDDLKKARNAFAAESERVDAKVKAGAVTFTAGQEQKAELGARHEAAKRETSAKAEELLQTIRSVDNEIKALQLTWTELELEIVTAAESAQLSYFRGVEARLQEFRPVLGGGRAFGLGQSVKDRRRMSGNFKRDGVLFGMSMKIKAADIPMLPTDSRIPNKYLGRILEIVGETEGLKRDILVNITADSHPQPGISWSFAS